MDILMEILSKYSAPVVFGICLCLGYILKHAVTTDKINKYIPLILGTLGIGINCWMTMEFTPETLLTGVFSGLASTGCHQAFKNLIEKFGKNKIENTEEISE